MTVTVKIRPNTKAGSKIAAFADAVIELPEGKIELRSFAVFRPNGTSRPSVAPAASKGDKKFFPHYDVRGELRHLIVAMILDEADKLKMF